MNPKTIILVWNSNDPAFTMKDFETIYEDMDKWRLNWILDKHKNVHTDDRFYFLRVGEGITGIVMTGYVASEPYEKNPSANSKKKTYFCDLITEMVAHPHLAPIISMQELSSRMPEFDWKNICSGQEIPPVTAGKLQILYEDYLSDCEDIVRARHGIRMSEFYTS